MTQPTALPNTAFTQPAESLDSFAPRILEWFETHGRHDLPWQQHQTDTPNPYMVWLSEVMLQQTQVATVLPYFARFMESFPTVQDLAAADWDAVAEHWAGLGYYARARNLHKGAKQLVAVINETGNFPQTVDGWQAIAGVGPSTAGAIVAMGLHGYGVICDGNVKRVLTRWAGIDGDITKSATDKVLWALATRLTPRAHSGRFAQGMMDMGATLCIRRKPACLLCPLQADCIAHAQGRETDYPVKAKKQAKPSKFSKALLLQNPAGELLWLQRPDNGIWGGLWSLPLAFEQKTQGKKVLSVATEDKAFEAEYSTAEQIIDTWLKKNKVVDANQPMDAPAAIKHSLTHFHWFLTPHIQRVDSKDAQALSDMLKAADVRFVWQTVDVATALSLPRAMVKILDSGAAE
ncbi:A/G-specific adenine glycosylase [Psychrobacter aestuarii]|uniref:Adenine DNA glycosylase n=1 Tax=Psychrobacter aestuarii TaxID=556327 RepID=A0ABN0W176_9GAMM|nr:A/G-specific adenine glycosylase [Psychrobacter aestuarii]